MELTSTRLRILKAIIDMDEGLNLTQIEAVTEIETGTVYNALKPLIEEGIVQKDDAAKYTITPSEREMIRKMVEACAPIIGGRSP